MRYGLCAALVLRVLAQGMARTDARRVRLPFSVPSDKAGSRQSMPRPAPRVDQERLLSGGVAVARDGAQALAPVDRLPPSTLGKTILTGMGPRV